MNLQGNCVQMSWVETGSVLFLYILLANVAKVKKSRLRESCASHQFVGCPFVNFLELS